jgi:tartrate-resistant acid phosphatase type 5
MRPRSLITAALVGASSLGALGLGACGDEGGATPGPVLPDGATPESAAPPPPVDAAAGDAGADDAAIAPPRTRFVLLGDFGFDNADELAVASLVKAWSPDFIVTLGDNSYPDSTPQTIDETIGKYYSDFIFPYRGKYGKGATEQRFYACLGNHDWGVGNVQAHTDYFDLPGNERYWEIQKGPVRFFCADSDTQEPDGTTADSVQGKWLQQRLGAATDPFRVVVFHHPAHSSGRHGSQAYMQWPFQAWGASAVYTGHDHDYERFDFGPGSIPYVVQGTGGADLRPMAASRAGSVIAYNEKHGATFVEADDYYAVFAAVTVGLDRIDEHVVTSTAEAARATDTLLASGATVRFFDGGAPATGWTAPGFDDAAWKAGNTPIGYGQGGEATVIEKGLAHYARARVTVADPSVYDHGVVWLKRDDGVAVYVNGEEIGRSNLAPGPLTPQTLAAQTVGYEAERTWVPMVVPRRLLRAGENVIAVELHQASAQSSDATLDIRFEGKR